MDVNQPILIAGLVITGVGVGNALLNHQGITKIVLGGYLLVAFLAVGDLIPGVSQIVSALALLAMVVALIYEGLPILQKMGVLTGVATQANPASVQQTGHGQGTAQ